MSRVSRQIDVLHRVNSTMEWVEEMARLGLQKGPVVVSLSRPKRTIDQNDRMWAMLTDISKQVDWYGQKLTKEEWKDVMTAGLKKQKAVPGLDGGFVVLGAHTSRMTKQELSDLMELISAFGAEHEVEWGDD